MWNTFKKAKPTEGLIIIRNIKTDKYDVIASEDLKEQFMADKDNEYEWCSFQKDPGKSSYQQGIERGYQDGWEDSCTNYGLDYDPRSVANSFYDYVNP